MLGCAYAYPSSKNLTDRTKIYWLNTSCIDISDTLLKKLDRFYLSDMSVNRLLKEKFKYKYSDNKTIDIALGDVKAFPDLTNGVGNWFSSPSRLDALYKIVTTSETALDAKQINLKFSGKFLVGGDKDAERVDLHGNLTEGEKKSIEESVTDGKQVKSVSTMIDIKRFVSDMNKLKLDEAYNEDLLRIGDVFGIPKELLGAIKQGSTYENQEKAIGRHIGYSTQAKADDLINGLETLFGYDKTDRSLKMTFDHLPSMQVFEEEKANRNKINVETLRELVALGADVNEVAPDLGFDYKFKARPNE